MRKTLTLCLVLCSSISSFCLPLRAKEKAPFSPVVAVDSGRLVGANFGEAADEVMFLGIPYAAPPVGDLRWRPPVPVAHWKGDYKADTFAPACPQPEGDVKGEVDEVREYGEKLPYYKNFRTSEDCLYLNVWTTNLSAKSKEPVMVWLHGGGGVAGNSWTPPFGPVLARRGVVLVSVEFRIGVFGTLAHPLLSAESPHHASGNYGTLDQIEALRWIHRNIAAFGGDSTRVTIFGQSDGGNKVCVLMASPLAQGLFQRAILESGQCTDVISPELRRSVAYDGTLERGTAEEAGMQLARDLKIEDGPTALANLRRRTPDEILRAIRNLAVYSNPTVDGWVLLEQPAATFRAGRQQHVPIIVGSTDDEMGGLYNPKTDPSTLQSYKDVLNIPRYAFRAEQLFKLYPATSDSEARTAYMALGTDDAAHGAYYFARDNARAGQKAYLFYFTYPSKGRMLGRGAVHAAELKFLAGTFPKVAGAMIDEDLDLIRIVQGYWTHFAATGDPNGDGLPKWPAYDPELDRCMDIGKITRSVRVPHQEKYEVIDEALRHRLTELESTKR